MTRAEFEKKFIGEGELQFHYDEKYKDFVFMNKSRVKMFLKKHKGKSGEIIDEGLVSYFSERNWIDLNIPFRFDEMYDIRDYAKRLANIIQIASRL